MPTKNVSNIIIPKETIVLDLKELRDMVKVFIKKYYSKSVYSRAVKSKFGYSHRNYTPTITVNSVFQSFIQQNKDSYKSLKKIYRYLNQNYNSKHKLRDLLILKLKNEGYTFNQIKDIIGLSVPRIKQVYYKIKNLIKAKIYSE